MGLRPRAGRTKGITHGRPPLLKTRSVSLSSKATRSIIRSHHKLRKAHAKAVGEGDVARAGNLERAINDQGGLRSYQVASTLGQSSARGGDSSKVLVEWLREDISHARSRDVRLRILEIGALSTQNACSQLDCVDVTRIDLHSQEPGIREIDFMDLPAPESESRKYQIISLSLVLNFVPDPAARGAMLKRIPDFLGTGSVESGSCHLPCLFLVLPLPCVANSRYLTDGRLAEMMASLRFSLIKVKKTSKLHYSLWKHERNHLVRDATFKKEKLRSGPSRNNFAITMLMGG
jgi:25S rRNA (adenine2142-N1)-methyltransferase